MIPLTLLIALMRVSWSEKADFIFFSNLEKKMKWKMDLFIFYVANKYEFLFDLILLKNEAN